MEVKCPADVENTCRMIFSEVWIDWVVVGSLLRLAEAEILLRKSF